MSLATSFGALGVFGCAQREKGPEADQQEYADPPQVVVVAPVLNLSGSTDWDALRITDIAASELQTISGFVVVPVDRTLGALSTMGRASVGTASDARELADELGADFTVVIAVTEYDPYDPPRIGLVLQCYPATHVDRYPSRFDPVSASRQAADFAPAAFAEPVEGPAVQIQAMFDASWDETLREVREYASQRHGRMSPYDWRIYTKSQELFARCSCWSAFRSMKSEWTRYRSLGLGAEGLR